MYNYIDNKNNTITDVYGGYVQPWTYGGTGTNPAPLNAEHTVPQSFFSSNEPMQSDIHHLFPCYSNWNSTRSNHPFADIDDNSTTKWMRLDQDQTTIPTSNIDEYSEYASSQFEPREIQKGNTARAIFYFYTMYPTQAGSLSSVGDINTLFQWHLQDPPDADEIQRNLDIETYQGNKNPYVEHPEWVADAFNLTASPPDAPTNVQLAAAGSNLNLSWTASSGATNYEIYRSLDNVNFSLLTTVGSGSTSYSDGSVTLNTTYYYYLIATNASGSSPASSTVSGQATGGSSGGNATDLFISEYIEGSSYNKALEIANFTGSAVDMSSYTLKKETNGGGSWGSDYVLSGSLADGDVWVIANSAADATILAQADVSTGSGIVTFNGNDVIGLFKGGTLIDILGTFGSSANYAQNITLVRKDDIDSPNSTYTTSEWDSYASNTFSYIGSHTYTGGTINPPVAVSNFALTATTSSLDLSWDDLADEDGYYLYRSSDNVNFSQIASPAAGATFYSDNTVTLEATYYYYIEGYNAGGTGAASATVSGATIPVAPNTPANLSLIATTIDLNLMWDDVANEDGYYLYRSTDNVNFSQVASLAADNTSYTDNTVQLLTTYYYYVVAHNAGGNSGNSNTASGATESTGGNATDLIISEYIEGSSYNKAIEIANFTGASVDLSNYTLKKETNGAGGWGSDYVLSGTLAHGDVWVIANSAADATILAQADVSTGSGIVTFNGNDALGLFNNGTLIDMLGTLGSSATYAQDVTLVRKSSVNSPSATYNTSQWDSYATNTFSYLGSHTMDGTSAPPADPTNLALTATTSSLDLTWDDVADEDGYYVYRSADNVSFSQIGSVGGDVTSYSDNSMSLETLYYYYVVAHNATGNSGNSNTVSGQTLPIGPPAASELFISEYIEGSSRNRAIEIANFTGAPVDLSNYSVKRQRNGAGNWRNNTVLSGTLADGEVYVIGHSSASSSITSQADLLVSGGVLNISGNDPVGLFNNGTLIDIVGTFNGGSANFGKNVTLVRKSSVTDPNTTYTTSEWDSYANNTFTYLGSHVYGGSSRVIVSAQPEVKVDMAVIAAKAYPNPFDQVLTVEYDLSADGMVSVNMFNMVGQQVKVVKESTYQLAGENRVKIETSDLLPGMYLLSIETENQRKIVRVVKH